MRPFLTQTAEKNIYSKSKLKSQKFTPEVNCFQMMIAIYCKLRKIFRFISSLSELQWDLSVFGLSNTKTLIPKCAHKYNVLMKIFIVKIDKINRFPSTNSDNSTYSLLKQMHRKNGFCEKVTRRTKSGH